jgi:hypothetical protein
MLLPLNILVIPVIIVIRSLVLFVRIWRYSNLLETLSLAFPSLNTVARVSVSCIFPRCSIRPGIRAIPGGIAVGALYRSSIDSRILWGYGRSLNEPSRMAGRAWKLNGRAGLREEVGSAR